MVLPLITPPKPTPPPPWLEKSDEMPAKPVQRRGYIQRMMYLEQLHHEDLVERGRVNELLRKAAEADRKFFAKRPSPTKRNM